MAWIALFLGVMGLLAVIAFHFPEHLTTPALREIYSERQVRTLLFAGLVLGSLLAPIALLFSRRKLHATVALACLVLAWLAGGANVPLDGLADFRFTQSGSYCEKSKNTDTQV